MTAVTYQVIDLLCSIRLLHGSLTHGHNPAGDDHHSLFFHMRSSNQQPTITGVYLCHKTVDALGSLKHVSFDINYLYYFITTDSILNATQMTKATNKRVKITPWPLRIHSTLKFTYVIQYDRRPHSIKQNEMNMRWQTAAKCITYSTPPLHREANPAMAF